MKRLSSLLAVLILNFPADLYQRVCAGLLVQPEGRRGGFIFKC